MVEARRHLGRLVRRATGLLLACASSTALAVSGTWSGELTGEQGERVEVQYRFSARGNLIFDVQTRSGPRAIEISHVGQSEQWLAPGSAIGRGRVRELVVSEQGVAVLIELSFDSTVAQGYLRNEQGQLALALLQQGGQLQAMYSRNTVITHTSSITGVRQERVAEQLRGALRRQP